MKRSLAVGLLGGVIVCLMVWIVTGAAGAQGQAGGASQPFAASALTAMPISSTFTYQGQLKQGSTPVNGPCDFQFGLWDAASAGTQVGITSTLSAVNVVNGLFTVALDFGASAFAGDARWLAIAVRCPAGSGTYAALGPRQALTPAPYAVYSSGNWGLTGNSGTSPASNFIGTSDNQPLVFKTNNTEGMRLDSLGNLGIGTTSPSDKLTVMNGTIHSARTAFLSEGFEGLTFPPAGWTTGGPDNWVRATNAAYQGSASAAITATQFFTTSFLDLDYTLPASGYLQFSWKANVYPNSTYLLFCLDNDGCSRTSGYNQRITGDVAWTRVSVPLTPGAHSFRWVIATDFAMWGSGDKAWLDSVQLLDQFGNLVADGSAVVDYLSVRSGAIVTGPVNIQGQVGIGTTNPQHMLHVVGQNVRVENFEYPRFSIHNTAASANRGKWQNYTSPDYMVFSALNDAENAETSWLTVYRGAGTAIDRVVFPTGTVGIGVTTPADKLDVGGELRVANCVKNSGGTQIAGTCPSDARLKKNIEPFPTMLDKVTQLQPVYFDWRADEFPAYHFSPNARSAGVLAQEVERILPELVSADEYGYKAVNYSEMPLLLLQALKELRAEKDEQIAAQRKEIDALQSQNTDLQKQVSALDARLKALEQKAPVVSPDLTSSWLNGNLLGVLALLIGAAMFYRGRK